MEIHHRPSYRKQTQMEVQFIDLIICDEHIREHWLRQSLTLFCIYRTTMNPQLEWGCSIVHLMTSDKFCVFR